MDLLQQQYNNQTKENKTKKIILCLIIICVVLLIISIIGIVLFGNTKKKAQLSLTIDDQNIDLTSGIIIKENEKLYVSLQQLSKKIGYDYFRGGYLEYTEEEQKCYLQKENHIIGYEAGNNKIFKYAVNSNLEYQYYTLTNNIINSNGTLYIAVEDLGVGCEVLYSYSEKDAKLTIMTLDKMIISKEEKLKEKSLNMDNMQYNNKKAILVGAFIVSNNTGKKGVVNSNLETVIGLKYSTIDYDEYTKTFIVSDDNKFGLMSINGERIFDLKYQELEIISYSPLLFKVKFENKYGVIDKNENPIGNIEYEGIGISSNNNGLVVIKNVKNTNKGGIVVISNRKYGIIDLETGKTVVNCELDGIYYNENNKKYYVKINNSEAELDEYIDYINTTVVNLSN